MQDLCDEAGVVRVLCVGSVFKSWDLLADALSAHLRTCLERLRSSSSSSSAPTPAPLIARLRGLELIRPTRSAAFGAAAIAARHARLDLRLDYSANYEHFATIPLM